MKTTKPFRLSLLVRPYRWQRRDQLGISVLALVNTGDDPRLMPEQELWQIAGEELDPGAVLDLGVPKQVPEVLVNGFGYTAHQDEKSVCAVRIRVAELEKTLTVFGNRYLLGGRSTPPQPFEQMRIDWAHAWGGAGMAENPLGIGTLDETINGVVTRRVPNIEQPGRGGRLEPAGFGALLPDWPQRMALMGRNHGQEWIEHGFPGFADDMDWRYFNAAPPDQHFTGRPALPPSADYEIWNMHPSLAVLRGRLPDWKARCFIGRRKDGHELMEAAPLQLTTAWFFPHRERVALIWQGACPVNEDDAADVKHIMAALELPDAPRTLAHYQEVLLKRIDPDSGGIHVMRDRDLVPPEVLGDYPGMVLPDVLSEPLARNMRAGQLRDYEARRAELVAQGADPDHYLAPPPPVEPTPTLDELPDLFERMEKEAAMTREEIEARHGVSGLAKPKSKAEAGAPPPEYPEAPDHLLRRFDPEEIIGELGRVDDDAPPELRASAAASGSWKATAAERVRQGYAHAAHLSDPAPALSSFRAAKIRRQLEAAPAGERNFARMNLIRADLSGMDLRGADFSDAMLEDARLDGALLDDCNFTRAVLARVALNATSLKRAHFDEANLGKAHFEGADLSGASLRQARCPGTRFEASQLAGADCSEMELQDTVIERCDLRATRWRQSMLHRMTLADVLFDGADFDQVMWVECTLRTVSFDGAKLSRCGFFTVDASQGVRFDGARLDACSIAHGGSFSGASFGGALLRHCGVRGSVLSNADFSAARFDGCDFSECDLRLATLDRVSAGESLFVRADFSGATLRDANLIDANLSKAVLSATDLRGANLFRADVSQTLIDGTTRMEDAYTRGAKIWPARRPGPAA
ncbi:DUF2169 domain-containing protein [Variovorax paradoxus]|nr:DUF2169 domain-containing protein [Variovorax paradoxus]